MAEFARVVSFDADDAALQALLDEGSASDGPPDGVPATRITVLANRSAGKVLVAVRFDSEGDLRAGAAVLDGMNPPDVGRMHRTSVDEFEVLLERGLT